MPPWAAPAPLPHLKMKPLRTEKQTLLLKNEAPFQEMVAEIPQ